MKYRKGILYQLAEDECFQTKLFPKEVIRTRFITLSKSGMLEIRDGYAWDGPSGPTKSIVSILKKIPFIGKWAVKKFLKAFMTPALGHDAKYQLIREGHLPSSARMIADDELKDDCLARGMSKIRAAWVHKGVVEFAAFAADPKNKRKIYEVK
jgi:hypothetical protein